MPESGRENLNSNYRSSHRCLTYQQSLRSSSTSNFSLLYRKPSYIRLSSLPLNVGYGDVENSKWLNRIFRLNHICHDTLLIKLWAYGLYSGLCLWNRSYITYRNIQITEDVQQSRILSPTLFLRHVNDFLSYTSNPINIVTDSSILHSSCYSTKPI